MSKLETNTIDTVSGTANLTIGGANNTGTTTIKSNNTAAITVDSSQNVGIGTTSPASELEIEGATPEIRIDATSASGRNYKIHSDGDELYIEGISSSGSLKIGEDGTYNFNVDLGNGQTSIGTATTNAQLFVESNNDSVSTFRLNDTSSGSGGKNIAIFQRRGTNVGFISVTDSATSFVTSSDHRLKENVSYDFDATTRLKQLKPARFNFIVDADKTVDGFLAHEVSSIVPEAITGTKDAVDEDGNPKYQGIDQSKLVPLLVKTIQELEARITELENA